MANQKLEDLQTLASAGGIQSGDLLYVFKPGGPDTEYKLDVDELRDEVTQRIFLGEVEASAASQVDFINGTNGIVLDDTYSIYEFELENLVPSVDDSDLYLRTTTDASAFDSGASDYQYAVLRSTTGGIGADQSTGAAQIFLCDGVGNATNESICGYVRLNNPSNASFRTVFGWFLGLSSNGSGVARSHRGSGQRAATEDVDGVRFLFAGGATMTGKIKLFGIL